MKGAAAGAAATAAGAEKLCTTTERASTVFRCQRAGACFKVIKARPNTKFSRSNSTRGEILSRMANYAFTVFLSHSRQHRLDDFLPDERERPLKSCLQNVGVLLMGLNSEDHDKGLDLGLLQCVNLDQFS